MGIRDNRGISIPPGLHRLLGICVLLLASPALAAERPTGVVELFTSQGCSSCPPADALLLELSQRDDLIALSYHVDYWDYLGWKDGLATPENSARQRAYGEAFESSVYTPQMVVNGRHHVVGSHREQVSAALQSRSGGEPLNVEVTLTSSNGSVFVDVGSGEPQDGDVHVVLVYYRPQQTVSIANGENEGRTIDYRNIVTAFQTIGMWHGEPVRLELPRSEMTKKGGNCAVLLQAVDKSGRPGAILGATRSVDEGW